MSFMSKPQSIVLSNKIRQEISAFYQLSADELVNHTISSKQGTVNDKGALIVKTGKFTGRSPKDRFLVKDDITSSKVWWGEINKPFSSKDFDSILDKMVSYVESKTLFVRDVFACSDLRYRMSIRVVNEYAWSNLFSRNMFIQPNHEELEMVFSLRDIVMILPKLRFEQEGAFESEITLFTKLFDS